MSELKVIARYPSHITGDLDWEHYPYGYGPVCLRCGVKMEWGPNDWLSDSKMPLDTDPCLIVAEYAASHVLLRVHAMDEYLRNVDRTLPLFSDAPRLMGDEYEHWNAGKWWNRWEWEKENE